MSLDCNQCQRGYEIQQYVEVPSQLIAVRCCRNRSELALSDTCFIMTFIDECDRGYLNILGLQSVGSGDSQTTVASVALVKRRSSSTPLAIRKKKKTCQVILESSPESDEGCSDGLVSKITKLLIESSADKCHPGKKVTVKYASSGESDCQYASAIVILESSCRSVKKIRLVASNECVRSNLKHILPDEVIIKKVPKNKSKTQTKIFFEGNKKSKRSKVIIETNPETSITSSVEIKDKRGIIKSKYRGKCSFSESLKSLDMDRRKFFLDSHMTMDLEKLKYAHMAATDENKSVEIKVMPNESTVPTGGTQFDQLQAYFTGPTFTPSDPVPNIASPIPGFSTLAPSLNASVYPMIPSPAESVLTIIGKASISGVADESGGRKQKNKDKKKKSGRPSSSSINSARVADPTGPSEASSPFARSTTTDISTSSAPLTAFPIASPVNLSGDADAVSTETKPALEAEDDTLQKHMKFSSALNETNKKSKGKIKDVRKGKNNFADLEFDRVSQASQVPKLKPKASNINRSDSKSKNGKFKPQDSIKGEKRKKTSTLKDCKVELSEGSKSKLSTRGSTTGGKGKDKGKGKETSSKSKTSKGKEKKGKDKSKKKGKPKSSKGKRSKELNRILCSSNLPYLQYLIKAEEESPSNEISGNITH